MFLDKVLGIEKIKMLSVKVKNKYLFRVAIIIKQTIYSRWATQRATRWCCVLRIINIQL